MHEIFEHTADFGLRVRAATLPELFAEAGRGLMSAICENAAQIRAVEEVTFSISGDRLDELFHDWLDELLYAFHAKKMLFGRFDVHIDDTGLTATAMGEPIDRARHQLAVEIKAITYHGLRVEQEGDQWLAEVIVDI